MIHAEVTFFWVSIFIYLAAFLTALTGFVRNRSSLVGRAVQLMTVAFIAHTITVAARWISAGHAPVTDNYELNLTGMWLTVLLFLVFNWLRKADGYIILLIAPVTFLVLGHGYLIRTEASPMGDAFNSLWLIVHVVFAWLSFGSYAISTGYAGLLIFKEKLLAWRPQSKIPDTQKLDMSGYRFIVLGFINHAIMIISGAIWAKKLWGRYWSWDALETWSLIAFLFYAFYLHARSFLNWKMKRAAWLAIAGLGVMIISFWGISWFGPSIHPGP